MKKPKLVEIYPGMMVSAKSFFANVVTKQKRNYSESEVIFHLEIKGRKVT